MSRENVLSIILRLVKHPSFTRTEGERSIPALIDELLDEIGLGLLQHGIQKIAGDPWERSFVWALLRGSSNNAVVLISHFDTVDVSDYGDLGSYACDPVALRERLLSRREQLDDIVYEHLRAGSDWLFGRGTVDMKAGIAAHLWALSEFCKEKLQGKELPGSIIFLSVPDEEAESIGIMGAVEWLSTLAEKEGLRLIGAINTDYSTPSSREEMDSTIHVGTIGKLLPSIYVRGVESHAGEPSKGIDANLLLARIVSKISMNSDLADTDNDMRSVAPVTLKMCDFKDSYDVRIPFESFCYINYLVLRKSPKNVIDEIAALVNAAIVESLGDIDINIPGVTPKVVTYDELVEAAVSILGKDKVAQALREINQRLFESGTDSRMRCAELVRTAWNMSGMSGPAAVVYFSPPYYPSVKGEEDNPLVRAVTELAANLGIKIQHYYPYISDASYMKLEVESSSLELLSKNMPIWSNKRESGSYNVPFESMRKVNLDVVNMGVLGFDAHKYTERLYIPYSCEFLPKAIHDVVLAAWENANG